MTRWEAEAPLVPFRLLFPRSPLYSPSRSALRSDMPRAHQYFVYILANRSRTLYIGVTNDLIVRVLQHRQGQADSFTARYKLDRLVYFERFGYIDKAIAREKFLKHFTRQEKIALIGSTNPTWEDLAESLPEFTPPLLTGIIEPKGKG